MNYEISCGAVVFTRKDNKILYVIIKSTEGNYGFPKGHIENNENYIETAKREIKEEVGLNVEINSNFQTTEEYPLPNKEGVTKRNIYFISEYSNQELNFQKEELVGAYLMSFDDAMEVFQFESLKRILTEANNFINNNLKH